MEHIHVIYILKNKTNKNEKWTGKSGGNINEIQQDIRTENTAMSQENNQIQVIGAVK